MNILEGAISLLKRKRPLIDVWHYILGNLRYTWYYADNKVTKRWRWLLRKHIREQIAWRIKVMNPKCYTQGECIICHCSTPALQMCDKACEGLCYPKMMNKKKWTAFCEVMKKYNETWSSTEQRLWEMQNEYRFCHIKKQIEECSQKPQ